MQYIRESPDRRFICHRQNGRVSRSFMTLQICDKLVRSNGSGRRLFLSWWRRHVNDTRRINELELRYRYLE